MSAVIDVITMFTSAVLIISNLKRINAGSRYIIYYIFCFVYVVPLFLDYIVGTPMYTSLSTPLRFRGFMLSFDDDVTRCLYDGFLIIVQLMILYWKWKLVINKGRLKNRNISSKELSINFGKREKYVIYILAIITPLLCIMTGREFITYIFGWRELNLGQTIFEQGNYSIFEKLSYLGVTASVFLLLWKEDRKLGILGVLKNIFMVVLLYSNMCIQGKRSILFFTLILCFMIQLYFGQRRHTLIKLLFSFGIILAIVVVTSVYVKTQFRGYSSFDNLYTTFRVDLFRDDTAKMVIYSLLNKQMEPLLSWPGQSYITQLYSLFPLDFLSGIGILPLPRIGFNVYLSSALANQSIESGINFMTTSMCDELIANFHLLGVFIIGPILVSIARFIDKQNPFEKILWIGGVVLLMLYSLNYISYYLEVAIVLHIFLKKKRKRRVCNE